MAAATFNAKKQIPQGRAQTENRVQLTYFLDFTAAGKLGDGTGLAATEDMEIGDLPAGYVHERLDAVLRTAEGEAATLDVGTEADPDGFGDGLNVNGTPNARIALAGTEAFAPGTYFHATTPIRVMCPAAGNTVNVAKVSLTFIGYIRSTED